MNAEPAFVEFRRVRKTYDGETLAVADLDLAVAKGEFLTLLGPSGSGKTTALMMLAGFEAPTAGEILMGGRSLVRMPPYKRDMGVVFQNYALFPHMSVARNIAFPLHVRGVRGADAARRVEAAMDLVRLGGYGERRPAQLSGGQQQRVALARALAFDPEIVLMDEPLGALDKQLREQLQIEIKHIQQRLGITVVYVTHDQAEALTLSDRIAVLNAGRIQQLAAPDTLYERPDNAFVAGFIGENNRMDGAVVALDRAECVIKTWGGLTVFAAPVGPAAAGDRAILSIRPERIELRPERPYRNRFEAQVIELIYLGDHTRVRLKLPPGVEIMARAAGAPGELGLATGDMVDVGWAAAHCLAFTADGVAGGHLEEDEAA